MKNVFKLATLGAACVTMFAACEAAQASTDEPNGINLGGTSFLDGFGGTNPGWIYEQYFQIEHFGDINGNNGRPLTAGPFGKVFKGTSITAWVSLNQLVYVTPYHFLGGTIAVTALLPVVDLSSRFASNSLVKLKSNGLGIGDVTFGPAIQFRPILLDGHPVFSDRIEADVIAPIGNYNSHVDINQSSGYFSTVLYDAFTILPGPHLELSARLNYLYNFRNDDPAGSGAPPTISSNYQAGQAVWANFAASYAIMPSLRVGINGYAFQQISQDKIDGVTQTDSETTNISVGPGLTYARDKTNFFYANAYLPVVEKNTTDGFNIVFRWAHVF